MEYKKAQNVLPKELVKLIQEYIDGEYLYIPRKDGEKKTWGETSGARNMLRTRNSEIYCSYQSGRRVEELSEEYYLSEQSIRRIICQVRNSA
jgi:Mor family transcriptional regulator